MAGVAATPRYHRRRWRNRLATALSIGAAGFGLTWLVLILLVSTLLSITSFTRGHVWWDDFASYIMQAQSLLHGTPADFVAHNRFTIENSSYPPGPVAYPWGFPALLAPFVAIFGLKISGLKLLNTFFFLCFLYYLCLPTALCIGFNRFIPHFNRSPDYPYHIFVRQFPL